MSYRTIRNFKIKIINLYKNIKEDYYGNEPILFDGIDVEFPEHDPKPTFFIELAKLSFEQTKGSLFGEIKNFTTQQNISGLPTSINLNGSNLDFAESINFSGLINHVNDNDIEDNLSLTIRKQKINGTKYKIIEDWELNISNGTIDRKFEINIHNGNIEGELKLNFVETSIGSNYLGEKNIIINSIDSVLIKISNFYVDIDISGTPGDYNTSIKSNLDNIVDKAVRNIVKNEANKVNDIITQVISAKTEELIKGIESEIKQLSLEILQVDDILNEAKKILKELP